MNSQKLATTADARARRLRAIEAVAVMGMTHAEAAAYSGMNKGTLANLMSKPEVKEYIADMQEAHSKKLNVSREQVIQGILDAKDHAKMVNEPATELRCWEAIAKMQGYNAPERHVHELSDDAKKLAETIQSMDDNKLYELSGRDNVLTLNSDDFHRVENE